MDQVRPFTHESGLKGWELRHSHGGTVRVLEYGAHVVSWVSSDSAKSAPIIFMSSKADFKPGSAIRGGIPVCFPQFSKRGTLPSHGFGRSTAWRTVESNATGGTATVTFELADSEETRKLWPHSFLAHLTVSLGSKLTVTLGVTNRSKSTLEFSAALHTYFQVGDISQCAIQGLNGARALDFLSKPESVPYIEYLERGERMREARDEVTIDSPTDCVYPDAPSTVTLKDTARKLAVRIEKSGFSDFVVWNPWSSGNAQLKDLHDDAYRSMLCIEPAQASTLVALGPGEKIQLRTTMEVIAG